MSAATPRARRPRRVPRDYGVPAGAKGMLAWSKARELFAAAPRYFITTVGSSGRPHVVQQWGGFVDGLLFFEGSPQTLWATNIAARPAVIASAEHDGHVLILHGDGAPLVPDKKLAGRIVEAYATKYFKTEGYRPDPTGWSDGGLFAVTPRHFMAWRVKPASAFNTTMTRFEFGPRRVRRK